MSKQDLVRVKSFCTAKETTHTHTHTHTKYKDNLWTGGKYSQMMQTTRDQFSKYTNHS